jgi:hypothetical protein
MVGDHLPAWPGKNLGRERMDPDNALAAEWQGKWDEY